MATLYELTNDFLTVYGMIDEGCDEQLILDTLEAIEGDIEVKAEGYAKLIKTIEAEAEMYKSEENRLAERRKARESKIKTLKSNLQNAMEIVGKTKFDSGTFSFNVQKNPPSVEIEDEAKIPKKFFVPQPAVLDKKTILSVLKKW